ncbi:unnamed protein product, partial [marine sediment metagenome]
MLFSTLTEVLKKIAREKKYFIPNNGHFDTTAANIAANRIIPVNLFSSDILDEFPLDQIEIKNPFKGDMDTKKLEELINIEGRDSIPLIYLTITNNTAAGQPVSIKNIKSVQRIA